MSNNNPSIPEIYTIAEGENLVINGMQSLPLNTEIPLGVTQGSSATLAIKAAAVENIAPDTQILLKDNATGIVQDLSDGSEYSFNASTQETGRFSLIFKAPSVTTSIDDVKDAQASIYLNLNHQITVRCNNLSPNAKVSVYNSVAQKIDSKPVISKITVIDSQFKSGIYFVTVFNMGKSITKKVVLQ
jgi:hypothetical protein